MTTTDKKSEPQAIASANAATKRSNAKSSNKTRKNAGKSAKANGRNEVAGGGEPSFFPATVFFPLHRVERLFADEALGEVESYAEKFRALVGRDVEEFLSWPPRARK